MNTFTKTYKVEINEKQKAALSLAFKSLASYFLNEKKLSVEVTVAYFDEKRISAELIVNGLVFDTKLIGQRGGITTL